MTSRDAYSLYAPTDLEPSFMKVEISLVATFSENSHRYVSHESMTIMRPKPGIMMMAG